MSGRRWRGRRRSAGTSPLVSSWRRWQRGWCWTARLLLSAVWLVSVWQRRLVVALGELRCGVGDKLGDAVEPCVHFALPRTVLEELLSHAQGGGRGGLSVVSLGLGALGLVRRRRWKWRRRRHGPLPVRQALNRRVVGSCPSYGRNLRHYWRASRACMTSRG